MERRKAITVAAAASLTMLAGAAGIALNSGIVGSTGDGNVGNLSPIGTAVAPAPTSLDDGSLPALGSAPDVLPADSPPVATSSASGYDDDEGKDDYRDGVGNGEEEGDHGDRYSDDQYEGADDDD